MLINTFLKEEADGSLHLQIKLGDWGGGAGQLFSCNTKSGFSVLQSSLVLRALGKASQRRLGEPMSSYLLLGREILMSPLLFLQGFSQCSFVTLGQGHSASESTAAAGACLT
jgi:hypothetical protein